MRETFKAWDKDGSGVIEVDELRLVLKALDPDFAERDLRALMRIIDTNKNGVVEYDEFCRWIVVGSPFEIGEGGFEEFVANFMREAGGAVQHARMDVAEVQIRMDGLYFVRENDLEVMETNSVTVDDLVLVRLDPEEFICKIELAEDLLVLTMNTGREQRLQCQGASFGPFHATEGFHICGLRTKPESDDKDRVVGVDLSPLPAARSYDARSALLFAAEQDFLATLRGILAKASVDVNSFGVGGATALMLSAQHGNTGAMRLLLGSKANPHIADADGWTALTFASKYGHTSAVDALLAMGATEKDGDMGRALRQALRYEHNSAARALLRAGFGPSPPGSFAIEEAVDPSACTIEAPFMMPAGSAFAKEVRVEIFHKDGPQPKRSDTFATLADLCETPAQDEESAEETDDSAPEDAAAAPVPRSPTVPLTPSASGVEIYYTLDGRDPFKVGRRYRGPLVFTAPRTHLRAVAVRGSRRSMVVDQVYVVCHYAIPDEEVIGTFKIQSFPEVKHLLEFAFATNLHFPMDRVQVIVDDGDDLAHKCWLRLPLTDTHPRHAMLIDESFASVRGNKTAGFVEKFQRDITRACGATPDYIEVSAEHSAETAHKAGAIAVSFVLARDKAKEIERQLGDAGSYLMKEARLRRYYDCAELQVVEPLGDRLVDGALRARIHSRVSKKADIDEVLGIGGTASGVIAVSLPRSELKKAKRELPKAVREVLPDVTFGSMAVGAMEMGVSYTVDVVSGYRANDEYVDGGTVVEQVNDPSFLKSLTSHMSEMHIPLVIDEGDKAVSRGLAQLEFHMEWELPPAGPRQTHRIQSYLDGICLVYTSSSLTQVIDFRSKLEDRHIHDGLPSPMASTLCRKVSRAITHSGDEFTDTGGEHRMHLDLHALPPDVTDLFIALAAFDCDDLSLFENPSVEIRDVTNGRLLTEYSIASAGHAQAVVMCSFTRDPDHGKWVVHSLGIPCAGSVDKLEPIKQIISVRQAGYQRWERRKDIVKLRVLWQHERITVDSVSEFAQILQNVLRLPSTAFQLLVSWL